MKKKIFAIVLTTVILGGALTVFANYAINQYEIKTYEESTKFEVQPLNITETDRISRMAEYIKTIETIPSNINDLIFDYAYIVQIYKPTENEMNYIDELIYSGADIADVIDIYHFWLTTNEDIKIIGQIYSLKDSISSDFWIEEAFNQITQNQHGVLNSSEVSHYLEQGLQMSDIETANELSRKGVYAISEILDMRAENITWDIILASVENNGVNNVFLSSVDDGNIILAAEDMAQKTNLDASKFIINNKAVENITEKENEINTETNEKVSETLNKLNVLIDLISDVPENSELMSELKQTIINNGISENDLQSLIDEGYMLIDILNASEVYKANGTPIKDALESGGEL